MMHTGRTQAQQAVIEFSKTAGTEMADLFRQRLAESAEKLKAVPPHFAVNALVNAALLPLVYLFGSFHTGASAEEFGQLIADQFVKLEALTTIAQHREH